MPFVSLTCRAENPRGCLRPVGKHRELTLLASAEGAGMIVHPTHWQRRLATQPAARKATP